MKNILITGGAGFIGRCIVRKLLLKGYNIRVYDNLSPQVHGEFFQIPEDLNKNVDFWKEDIRDKESLKKAIENQDIIIHLAAETGTGQSMYEISKYVDTNILGTANILDCIINSRNCVQKIILSSSRAVYGEGKYKCKIHGFVYPGTRKESDMKKGFFENRCPVCGTPVTLCATTEDSMLHPSSVYGITKQIQEKLIQVVCSSIGLPYVIYRYQNVFGAGQSLSNPYTGILSIFSNLIMQGKMINIFEDGLETRDFVYVDDVADATVLGIENDNANNLIFNVGSGSRVDVNTVVNILEKAYCKKTEKKITGDFRIGDIRHNYADISLINDKLGYCPKVDFKDGIKMFADWVSLQNCISNNYEKSLEEMKQKGLMK